MPESQTGIRIQDIAYTRLRAPDLDVMEQFLLDFGMVRAARTPQALYMRGTGPSHHLHVTEKGDEGFISLAYHARSEEDLHRVAGTPGASAVHALDEPGGGKRVLLTEPTNGFRIEIVHGMQQLAELPIGYRHPNWDANIMRGVSDPTRLKFGPAHVRRISHGVLSTPHLQQTIDWFATTLGLLRTDEFYTGSREEGLIGCFYRLDRGSDPVDHHVLNCYLNPVAGYQHASFVVESVEDMLIGHNHLSRLGKYTHMRGVGYHPPGGQVYDYWLNPWSQMHELYFPTQQFTSENQSNEMPMPPVHDRGSAFANNITRMVASTIAEQ